MAKTPIQKQNLSEEDFRFLAEFIILEQSKRSRRRKKIEEVWAEIDRQVAMIPQPSNIDIVSGRTIEGTEWMPFVEQPFQAQTLEVLVADSMALIFPEGEDFFAAHSDVTEEFLVGIDPNELFGGTRNPEDPAVTQENIDAIVEAVHFHYQGLYDYRSIWNLILVDCFKRGTFAAKYDIVTSERFDHQTRGVLTKKQEFPMLIPYQMDDTYFADELDVLQHSNAVVGKQPIRVFMQDLGDLKLDAKRGGTDAGWRPKAVDTMEPLREGNVKLLEYEGDLIVPRSDTKPLFLANVTFTAVMGKTKAPDSKEKDMSTIIRFKENEFARSTFVTGGYSPEDARSPYMTSPLVKGMPIQKAMSEASNRASQAAILQTEPPIGYNDNNAVFSANRGINISPRAQNATIGEIQILQIGDVTALSAYYFSLVALYENVTGVNRTRLGAQTKSHQTRFAVNQEAQRGQARTVDYVRSVMIGAMRTSLEIEWMMIKKVFKGEQRIYVAKFDTYLNIQAKHLPDRVLYEVRGAAEPFVEQEELQAKIQGLTLALQVDQARKEAGEAGMDLEEFQRFVLQESGFTDVDKFFAEPNAPRSQGALGELPTQPQLQEVS